MTLKKQQLEHFACKMMKHMSENRNKKYDQCDIMKHCNVNIIDAIEISNFLTDIGACDYKMEKK